MPLAPMLMFAILFGLSMDYEVFLLSRVREHYLRHGDPKRAIIDGVSTTGRVITSAALIMIAVFGAFILMSDVTTKTFGVGLSLAILFDVTLVRMVLVPACHEPARTPGVVAAGLARPPGAHHRPGGRRGATSCSRQPTTPATAETRPSSSRPSVPTSNHHRPTSRRFTMSTVVREGREARVHRATLPVIMLALATVVSAVASLNVAIPSIARDTHATQTELSWIIDAYALVFAALLLLGGAIGDRYGRRRTLIAGLVIFGGASLAAMTVSGPTSLIVLRGLLGVGAALVMPATLSTITSTFPAEQRTRAVGAWAGVAGASAILGLLMSGLLLEVWSWQSVFGLNVVLAVVAIIGAARFIPESAEPGAPRLDLVGAVLTVAGLGALVYSVIEAPTHGWDSAETLAGIAIGLLILVGFVRLGALATEPADRPPVVPAPCLHGRDPVDHRAVLRLLRPGLPDAAVPAAGARLHAAGRRAEPDPDGRCADAERSRDRAPAVGPDRGDAGLRPRPRADQPARWSSCPGWTGTARTGCC